MSSGTIYSRGMDVRGGILRNYEIRSDGKKVITNIKEILPLLKERERELRRNNKI